MMGLLDGNQRAAALLAQRLGRAEVGQGGPAVAGQGGHGGEPFQVGGHAALAAGLLVAAQRLAEQVPGAVRLPRVAGHLAEAVEHGRGAVGVAGGPEGPQRPPQLRGGVEIAALVAADLASMLQAAASVHGSPACSASSSWLWKCGWAVARSPRARAASPR